MRFFKALFLLTALFATLSFTSATAQDTKLEKVTVAQWGKEKVFLYLPFYIAMEEGLFAKQGLDVDVLFSGNDDQVFATVIGGSADFGMGDPVFTAIAKEKNGPGKVVAMLITRLGFSGYTNKPEVKEITDPAQMNGLRFSSFPEPSTTYTLLSGIKKKHAPKLEIVQGAFGSETALLEAGKVDVAVNFEPATSIAEDKGYRVVFDLEKYTEPQAITGITTSEEIIKNKPETVQKFVTALQEAMNLLHSDKEASFRTAKKLFPDMKDSVIQAAVSRTLEKGMYPKSIVIDDAYWQNSIKARIDSGDLKNPQATEVAVDNSFALKAAESQPGQ